MTLQEPPNVDVNALAGFVRWGGVLVSMFVVAGAMVVLRIVGGVADRLGARFANRRLVIQKVDSFARFFIYIATGAVVLGLSVRLDSTALTVIGGALAFAIGFAMRDLVAAFIAGVTIMFDRPFQVGDRVQYAGEYGDIIQIGLRSVRMRTLDDNMVTIPNNKVLTEVAASANYGALDMQVTMKFYVGIDQDIATARELVHEALLTSRYIYLDKPIVIHVRQVIEKDYVAVELRAKGYVLDTRYEQAFITDVNLRVLEGFGGAKIAPPAVLHRNVTAA
jgi:small-conductance mechanosensitive channel